MKRGFTFSFQHRVILVFLLFVVVCFCLTGYLARSMTHDMVLQEKEGKLLTVARILDAHLPTGGFDAILKQHNAEDFAREEKIRILNKALLEVTDDVGMSSPGMGVGYYSRDLDAIVTYGPSISFGKNVGVSVAPAHPGRMVMQTGTPMVQVGTMVRGDILNAMIPVKREGRVIGYIWANELEADITVQLNTMTRNLFFAMAACSVVAFLLLLLLSRRTLGDMNRIIRGVRAIREDLSVQIEGTSGDLGEVVDDINKMAADLNNAMKETSRAIAVLQNVTGNVDAIIYVVDPQTMKIVYANDFLLRCLRQGNVEGRICHEVLFGEVTPCSFCPHKALLDGKDEILSESLVSEHHYPLINRDFLTNSRLITWPDGRRLHLMVGTDITERNALAVAEATSKAKQDFVVRLSNELKVPMGSIQRLVQIATDTSPSLQQLRHLKEIQSAVDEVYRTISDIVDYSRIDAGALTIERAVFNVREMLENVRTAITLRINENDLDFTVTADDSVPEYVVGDGLRFSQILLNLLGNATRFTINGSVSLYVAAELLPGGLFRLDCTIRDTGISMSRTQLERLFDDPFSLSSGESSPHTSSGGELGLFISKALVGLMGGELKAASRTGVGAGNEFSFFVICDSLYGTSDKTEVQDGLWQDVRYEGERILVADDSIIGQEAAEDVLSELGLEVDVVSNGVDAVRFFLQQDYAMILISANMPVISGLEIAQRIRGSNRPNALKVPIVMMTSRFTLEERLTGKDTGIDAYVALPLNTDELKVVLYQQIKMKKRGE